MDAPFGTGPSVSSSTCRVLVLAPLLRQLRRAADRRIDAACEAFKGGAAPDEDEHRGAVRHLLDQEAAVREIMAACEASSLEGAGIQVGLILARLDLLFDRVSPDDEIEFERDRRALARMLHSVLRVIDRSATHSLDTIVDGHFFERALDPWEQLADASASTSGQASE